MDLKQNPDRLPEFHHFLQGLTVSTLLTKMNNDLTESAFENPFGKGGNHVIK